MARTPRSAKKVVFVYAENRVAAIVASSKKVAAEYLRALGDRAPTSTIVRKLLPITYDRGLELLWYRNTSGRTRERFVDVVDPRFIPDGAWDGVKEGVAPVQTRGPIVRVPSKTFGACVQAARESKSAPLADVGLALEGAAREKFLEAERERRRPRCPTPAQPITPGAWPPPGAPIPLPALPPFRHEWTADPGHHQAAGTLTISEHVVTQVCDGESESVPLRDWLRGRRFGGRVTFYFYAGEATRRWLAEKLGPLEASGLAAMPPETDDGTLLELARAIVACAPDLGDRLRALSGRDDPWLVEQATWLLRWSGASRAAFGVLDAVDRPLARALALERARVDAAGGAWVWSSIADALARDDEGLAWAERAAGVDPGSMVAIARVLWQGCDTGAFFELARRVVAQHPAEREELEHWISRHPSGR